MKKIFRFSIFCFCILCHFHSDAQQIIATYAGNGTMGYSGDGGPAIAAEIYNPNAIAVDDSGNVFVGQLNSIRRVDVRTGLITTIAGTGVSGFSGDGGPAIAAQFSGIEALTFDTARCLYVADMDNSRIRKIDPSGIVSTIAGNGTSGYSGDGGPATAAQLGSCKGIACDTQGNIYYTDIVYHVVRKIDRFGIISTIAGNGTLGYSGDGGPATAAQLSFNYGVAVDKGQNIYIGDKYHVRKIAPSGIITNFAGSTLGYSGDGGPATAAQFNQCAGLSTDTAGNLYISDPQAEVVRKINASGIISTIAGNGLPGFAGDGGLATAASLYGPYSIAIWKNGVVFVGDLLNARIRVLDHPPHFAAGAAPTLSVCSSASITFVDTLLAISDTDQGQPILWSLLSAPVHGTAAVSDTAIATSSTTFPSGLSYTPFGGYVGPDSFQVRVTDGILSDTMTIYVTLETLPSAGVISGQDSVCVGNSISLTNTIPGGVWNAINGRTTVSAGLVSGISFGIDTVIYIVSNACGADTTFHTVTVVSLIYCPEAVKPDPTVHSATVLPNPNNGQFTFLVTSPISEEIHLTLTDVTGRITLETTVETNKPTSLNAGPGIYFINAVTPSGVWSKKVVAY